MDRLLSLARAGRASSKDGGPQPRRSVLWRVGTGVTALWVQLGTFAGLIGESLLSVPAAATGRLQARAVDVLELVKACGADALPIIAIVNGLVGAILGFVGAVQLQRFGAATYVIDLVGVAVVREMAPIMTAIVMAGRTGGAYAAQIATMQGNEEVDALQTLGISVDQFLVVPRIIAALTMTPLLYAYGCFMGLLGGLVVCIAVLHMSPVTFFVHLRPAIPWTEFAIGLTKSICFGTFVAFAGCRTGLAAGRSAFDVGRAATHAVVQGIIGIIALDAVFAACTNVMGL
ncbi:MAG TPA: ABC transporter permease [Acetobacteraceae bacterium]|nr:ABC transporter permease [Acetobacteraceae bacterium]